MNAVGHIGTVMLMMSAALLAQPSVSKLWETEPVFKTPESVAFDSSRGSERNRVRLVT